MRPRIRGLNSPRSPEAARIANRSGIVNLPLFMRHFTRHIRPPHTETCEAMAVPLGNGGCRKIASPGPRILHRSCGLRSAAGKRGKLGKQCESSGGIVGAPPDARSIEPGVGVGLPARRLRKIGDPSCVSCRREPRFRDQLAPANRDRPGKPPRCGRHASRNAELRFHRGLAGDVGRSDAGKPNSGAGRRASTADGSPDIREDVDVTHVETDIQQMWLDYRDRPTVEMRNRFVEMFLPLEKYNAERIWARLPDGVELDDLISAGVFGLMDAIDAFDLTRGVKFETYCVPRIRGAMLDELRTMDWVPRLVRSKSGKMEAARKQLEAALGRPPRPEELAEKLGIPLEQIDDYVGEATAVNLVSLNKKWYETDSYKDVREIDILEDKKAEDPTHRLQNRDLMRLVTRGLNRNERLIVILYYYEEMTMKEIGATLNLSESRVSQMHSSIVQRLQSQLSQRRPEFSN